MQRESEQIAKSAASAQAVHCNVHSGVANGDATNGNGGVANGDATNTNDGVDATNGQVDVAQSHKSSLPATRRTQMAKSTRRVANGESTSTNGRVGRHYNWNATTKGQLSRKVKRISQCRYRQTNLASAP